VTLLYIALATQAKLTEDEILKQFDEISTPLIDSRPAFFLEIGSEGLESSPSSSASSAASASTAATVATYIPDSGPYDNPATDAQLVASLPQAPSCTIRGQTIFEIRKMRQDAKQIGMAIMYEIQVMEKRKTYVEEMTQYLNDRIRELNKVKTDLQAEQKWIQVSNARISELAQKEKLIKLQDVMSCIKDQQQRLSGETTSKTEMLTSLKEQETSLNVTVNNIRNSIDQILTKTV